MSRSEPSPAPRRAAASPMSRGAHAPQDPPATPQRPDDDLGRTRGAPAQPLDARRLRSLFLDLLGRPPFEGERAEWLGRGTREFVTAQVGSEAFWRHWLHEQLYYFLLVDDFRPVGEAIDRLPTDLAAGKLSARDALHRIALLPSFDLRNPGADTFVTVVMEQYVGITVQLSRRELEIGKGAYDGRPGLFLGAQAGNQADVVRVAVEHKDAARHFLAREYSRLMGVEPDRRELAAAARTFHKDPWSYPDLVREWLLTDAYAARLERGKDLPNRTFVRVLFVDLMGREPTGDEAETLRGALDGLGDPRPLRSVVARMLLDSGRVALPDKASIADPTRWIAQQFERFLGRAASQDELQAFVGAFRDPACQPRTVLQVLLSDPAYHRY